jgi:hypothetical protein
MGVTSHAPAVQYQARGIAVAVRANPRRAVDSLCIEAIERKPPMMRLGLTFNPGTALTPLRGSWL